MYLEVISNIKKILGKNKRVLRIAFGKLTKTINCAELIPKDLVDIWPMFNMMTMAKNYLRKLLQMNLEEIVIFPFSYLSGKKPIKIMTNVTS